MSRWSTVDNKCARASCARNYNGECEHLCRADCVANKFRNYRHGHYTSARKGRKVKAPYSDQDVPTLILDKRCGRTTRYTGVYRIRRNQVVVKAAYAKEYNRFMHIYLHELAHWATWHMLDADERRSLHWKYGQACAKMKHDERLVERIAIAATSIWENHELGAPMNWAPRPKTITKPRGKVCA